MTRIAGCRRGHQWPVSPDARPVERPEVCPVCGEPSSVLSFLPDESGTTAPFPGETPLGQRDAADSPGSRTPPPIELAVLPGLRPVPPSEATQPPSNRGDNPDSSLTHYTDDGGSKDPFPTQHPSTQEIVPPPPHSDPNLRPIYPRVGEYEILDVLGRGAMGVVYKARHRNLNRVVALKMIRGRAGREELARFRAEAEAVAGLQHPNIVQLYEFGEHDGRPFFALEFVGGGSLESRAPADLGFVQVARLVEQLARAMHYAHAQGVVHRDLKPANILLTGARGQGSEVREESELSQPRAPVSGSRHPRAGARGWDKPPSSLISGTSPLAPVPKITDFGLVKRMDGGSRQTLAGVILGTPSYMAPEQALGQSRLVGPAADVYSLGAILYDLLTGRPPFRGESVRDTLQQVMNADPVPPGRLMTRLPRDVETICLKCLEKEPRKRYATAGELADDLERFQRGEPIRARATPALERAAKWARRRPALATLLGVLLVGVVVGVGAVLWYADHERRRANDEAILRREAERQRGRAERRSADAFTAADELLTRVGYDRLGREPRLQGVRAELLGRALEFYRRFLDEAGTDPAVRQEVGKAWLRVGEIQRTLGHDAEAEASSRAARNHFDSLHRDFPDELSHRIDLAAALNDLATLWHAAGRAADAERTFGEALGLLADAVEARTSRVVLEMAAVVHHGRGNLRLTLVRVTEAEVDFGQAAALLENAGPDPRSPLAWRRRLARAHSGLAATRSGDRPAQAAADYQRAIDTLQDLRRQDPDSPDVTEELAVALHNRAVLRLAGNGHRDAAEDLESAVGLLEALADDYRKVPDYRRLLAESLIALGRTRQLLREHQRAEQIWERAVNVLDRLAGQFDKERPLRQKLGQAHAERAACLIAQGQEDDAAMVWKAAVLVQRKLTAEAPEIAAHWKELADTHQNQADVWAELGRDRLALDSVRALVSVQEGRVRALPEDANGYQELAGGLRRLAKHLERAGLPDEARSALERAGHREQEANKLRGGK